MGQATNVRRNGEWECHVHQHTRGVGLDDGNHDALRPSVHAHHLGSHGCVRTHSSPDGLTDVSTYFRNGGKNLQVTLDAQ